MPREKETTRVEYTLYGPMRSTVRSIVDGGFSLLNIPRVFPVIRNYDLVHSCRGIIILGSNNYVVDFEHASSFAGMDHARMQSTHLRQRIKKALSARKCARLLPYSQAALHSLYLLGSGKELTEKATVVYPTVITEGLSQRRPHAGPPRILFYGEYYWKGGRELLRACELLSSRVDFILTYISLRVHPPHRVIEEAKKKISLEYREGPIPRRMLFNEIYPATDIFAMPTYLDTLGYAFLEAMAHGIPCVGARHFATPEIIRDGVTGMLIEPPVRFFDSEGRAHPEIDIRQVKTDSAVSELAEVLEELISSESLRNSMGAASRNLIEKGELSIYRRNALLKEIYENSLKR